MEAQWLLALGMLALACLGAAINAVLPILAFGASDGPKTVATWHDLWHAGGLPYEQHLLVWPFLAAGMLAVASLTVVFRAYRPPARAGSDLVARLCAGTTFVAGTLLSVVGARWIGFALARQLDSGPLLVHLRAVPYIDLGLGLGLAAGSAYALASPGRDDDESARPLPWPFLLAAAAAFGLVALPLFPLASMQVWGGGRIWWDEFTLALMDAQSIRGAWDALGAIGLVRIALWSQVLVGVAASVVEGPVRWRFGRRWSLGALVILGLAWLMALGFAARFYQGLPHERANVTLAPNPILPLVVVLEAWILGGQARFLARSNRKE